MALFKSFAEIYAPPGGYQIVYADPPWAYRDKCNSGMRGVVFKYQLMTVEQICALGDMVKTIAADNCLLALWWVPPQPAEALRVVEAWGFEIKTMLGFSWLKLTTNGLDHFGMGNWTRANQECCLFAARGKPKRVKKNVRQIIRAPRREHSQKPDEARDRLVDLMGDVPRIELFARQQHAGWAVAGDEL